ncbi:hypothetical protein THASP1DRAFT_33204 [Thamnocephalis sphaerospora]|uniref:Uncharacterized protein n=1 Tax=Thamnocephalis sphaerospora TaxID=78915 RepID=A0A4P9XH38_9FUNG|nr:hypothetical protein THASP1DRAFT_33204 [Thamnocephalis sphaerospora]|eukprot:RKP04974.1 hypothetical protein THASP1DRAFT_33204 [Thamnocephalis sphaerospora]
MLIFTSAPVSRLASDSAFLLATFQRYHLGLLALDAKCNSNSGQLLWLCEANVTGVELLPGNDLLLAWSSGSGVHQLRRLSTGECVRTFFGRRWHPAVPALGTFCVATVPSSIQLIFALLDMAANASEDDTSSQDGSVAHPLQPLPVLLNSMGASHPTAPGVLGQLASAGQVVEAVCPTYCCIKTPGARCLLEFASLD